MSIKVLRSARTISALTLVSRVLGLLRDMACSFAFGVSGVWSSFSIAFQVPNLFRRLFGEGALSAASIPVLTETLTREGPEGVDALAGRLVGLLVAVLTGICLAGEVIVAGLYLWYRSESDTALTFALTGLTLPYLILVCTIAALGGVQNVFGRFAAPAMMPIVLNVFMIAAALSAQRWIPADRRAGVVLLAGAVTAAGVVQLAWQWRATRRCGLRLRLRLDWRDRGIRRIALTMLPMIAGLGVVQVNTLLDSLIAWWFVAEEIGPGGAAERVGPAVLYFAQRLYEFPLGVFAIALATAIFPALSRHAAEDDLPGLSRTLSHGIRVVTFEGLPCLVGLILIREPLVIALFGRGRFADWPGAAERVGFALSMYALGIWAYGVNQLLVRAFYAVSDAMTPLKISVASVGLNVTLNLILVQTALREGGLALATSICAVGQSIALLAWLRRRVGVVLEPGMTASVVRTMLATVAMAAVVVAVDGCGIRDMSSLPRLLALSGAGAVTYLVAGWLLRSAELREILWR